MSIAKDKSAVGSVVGTTTASVTLNSVTAGSLIPICVAYQTTSNSTISITDSIGDTVQAAFNPGSANGFQVAIFYIENASAGNHTISSSIPNGGTVKQSLVAGPSYTGVLLSGSYDSNSSPLLTGSSTSPASNSLTTSEAGELVIGTIGVAGTVTCSAFNNSFVNEFTASSGGFTGVVYDVIKGSPGSIAMSCTASASRSWWSLMAAFKPALAQAPCGYMQTYAMR